MTCTYTQNSGASNCSKMLLHFHPTALVRAQMEVEEEQEAETLRSILPAGMEREDTG